MFDKWWWNLSSKLRRVLLTLMQTIFAGIFAVLLGLAILESVKDDPDIIYLNLLVLAFVFQLALIGFIMSRQKQLPWYWREFADLRHEFTGAFVLAGLLFFLVTIPSERKAEHDVKAALIWELGSTENGMALRALSEVRSNGWLFDGTLQNRIFNYANLQYADLTLADLRGANFWQANLQGANLEEANFQNVLLSQSDMKNTFLMGVDFRGARLDGVNLAGANLILAAKFDAKTILPDSTNWTSETDLTCFTNSRQSCFWRGAEIRPLNDLHDVDLSGANLRGSYMVLKNLNNANLVRANLQGAHLGIADLKNADLWQADLQGADLWGSNLQGANLTDARFNESTTLPDGTHWKPDTDINRFTDPNHPDFWRSSNPDSPAYPSNSN